MKTGRICVLTLVAALCLLQRGIIFGEVIVPTSVATINLNAYGGTGPTQLIDNSGMTPAVNNGDTLEAALAAVHTYGGGYAESYISNASGSDYFAGYGSTQPPIFIWDLTSGGDVSVGGIILWQYQNNGGNYISIGNHAYTIDLQFNTEAQGAGTFSGPVTTIAMKSVVGLNNGNINTAQLFELSSAKIRYVKMVITNNHYGDPASEGVNPTGGGDRVGFGEIRFATSNGLTNFSPVNNEEKVAIDTSLSWEIAENVTDTKGYYVSLGTDPNDPNGVYQSDNNYFEAATTSITLADLSPSPTDNLLTNDTVYFWKVDRVDTADNVIEGTTLSFRTIPATPVIEKGPANDTAPAGGTAILTVETLNEETITWYKTDDKANDTPDDDSVVTDSDGNPKTLQIADLQLTDEGYYYCVAKNIVGEAVSQPALVMTERLIGHWKFDNSMTDELGVNDGILFSGIPEITEPNYTTGTIGDGQAIILTGDQEAVEIPYSETMNPSSFTLSMWVWVDPESTYYRTAFSNRNDGTSAGQQGCIIYATSGNKWQFWTGTGAGWHSTGSSTADSNVVPGVWTHLAVSLEATGTSGDKFLVTKRLFINGIQVGMSTNVTFSPNPDQETLFGAGANESDAHDFFFYGLIDDAQMWNYALDSRQIAHIYTDQTGETVCVDSEGLQYDYNGNCVIDLEDFATFAATWLNCRLVPDCD